MKTILMTAYAVNPKKGSEDGMGWNYITSAAKEHNVIAVTRRNNRGDIEAFMANDVKNKVLYDRIFFMYFDWPSALLFWKKGSLLSMIYFYMWQCSLALWLLFKKPEFDIAHNLNFHNDWTPSFLWILNKPFAWGPVGHHPKIDRRYLAPYGVREVIKDRMLWWLKLCFWHLDPFLYISRRKAHAVWCMHQQSADKLRLQPSDYFLHPSVSVPDVAVSTNEKRKFTVLSIGRFVPLKGFDVTIKSFAKFYHALDAERRSEVQLLLVGKGPFKEYLCRLIEEAGISEATTVKDWMPAAELAETYQQASVFLFPSHEGAGMVVAEAMRHYLPVLCWDNAGPGNITPATSLLKVPYADYNAGIAAFAERLKMLQDKPEVLHVEGLLARRRFVASLSTDCKAEQLTAFYHQMSTRKITVKSLRYE